MEPVLDLEAKMGQDLWMEMGQDLGEQMVQIQVPPLQQEAPDGTRPAAGPRD